MRPRPDRHMHTWYHEPCTRYYQVPGTWYQVPGTWYLVPGTRYQVPSYFPKVRIFFINIFRTFGKYGFVLSESTNYIEKVWSRVEKQKIAYSINIFGLLIFSTIYISRNYIWRAAVPVENAV